MAVLGISIGRLRLINCHFRQNGFTRHRFGFRHLYPHLGHSRRFGIVFNLHRQMAGRERLYRPQLDIPHPIRPRYRRILLAYFKALQLGNASQVAPVDKFSLVLVALMAVVFLDERPSTQEWIGLGLVTAGVLTLALKR